MSYNSLFGLGTHSADTNLLAYYLHNDSAANTTVTDSSGLGNDGVHSRNTNTVPLVSNSWYSGTRYGGGEHTAYPASLAGKQDVTISAFADPDTTSDGTIAGQFWQSGNSGERDWLLWWDVGGAGTGYAAAVANGGTVTSDGTDNNDPDSWQHVAATFNATDFAVYVQGTQTVNNGGNMGTPSATFSPVIGAHYSNSSTSYFRGFKGWIGPIAFFDRVLTQSEIQEHRDGPEPLNLTAPSVTGTHETGQTITSTNGTWDSQANGTLTYTYQWQTATDASGTGLANISGATSSSYTLTASEVGLYVRCLVASSNDGGNDSAEDTGSTWTLVTSGGPGPTFQPAWAMNATIIIQ